MYPEIKQALDEYKLARTKTYEFLKTLPQEKMTWRPHEQLGTFGMQLRHMTKSQQAYVEGIKKGTIDFSDKSFSSDIETSKVAVLKRFKELDQELVDILKTLKPTTKIIFNDGVHGTFQIDV